MKKLFLALCVAMSSLCALAESGDMAAGLNLNYGIGLGDYKFNNPGIGVKYQYSFSDVIRAQASFNYGFKNKGVSCWDVTADVHYLFNVSENIRVYPLVGIGYAKLKASGDVKFVDSEGEISSAEASSSLGRMLVNLGVGGEYLLTENWSVNLEVKYQYRKDFGALPVSLGVSYRF